MVVELESTVELEPERMLSDDLMGLATHHPDIVLAQIIFEHAQTHQHKDQLRGKVSSSNARSNVDTRQDALIKQDDLIGLYLLEIQNIPPLSSEQQHALSDQIKSGLRASDILESTKKTPKQAVKYSLAIATARDAKNQLVNSCLYLAYGMAKRYIGRGVNFDDLIQVANIALLRAASSYDADRGAFSTYATYWCRKFIQLAIVEQGYPIKLPPRSIKTLAQIYKMTNDYIQENHTTPTLDYLAKEIGVARKKILKLFFCASADYSLNEPSLTMRDGDTPTELGDLLNDSADSPLELTEKQLEAEELDHLLNLLPARDAKILRLRFGLHQYEDHTLEEIGHLMVVTRASIHQREKIALKLLRELAERSRKPNSTK